MNETTTEDQVTADARALMTELGLTPMLGTVGIGAGEWVVIIYGRRRKPTLVTWKGWPVRYRIGGGVPRAADGDEWDRLSAAFAADWRAAYSAAFVRIAMERGWSRENAESWPDNIVDDALIDAREHDYDPEKAAKHDVIECEGEADG